MTAQEMNTTDHTSDCEAVSVQTSRLQVDESNINKSITVGKKAVRESHSNGKKELVFLPSIKSNNRFNYYFKNLYYVNKKSQQREKYSR